ncbi:hypothetical protein A2738_00710 [Candidatus Nomurabacteria bacterium RIFCSPHIGHO2_01_FULL_42_15]|uniref:Guanylate kinase-like domain-containing protein n=1 Tax=Candidatus Nomurabacteria bacterium RIFCSPHIGHO2_01_FULL_42_15 TaxID=1801742 RepID=A0A1F6VFN7_9BACT|nr:MAG: hypothetical protein A2738_00710 [Candidatus Nomurabacteria bacterium RIFCSPHIGHO2_01_FULL_42_15]OGI93181.1 MAG: hypothetical protein A3A99_01460 [Candidatus Nomurabacteria bacterium RIFCSPLOWO2_01_FULL_41_18]
MKKPITHVGINGPPGAGKTTVLRALEHLGYKIHVIPRYYTRPKRPGEESEKEYRFVTEEQFQILWDDKFFIPGTIRQVEVNGKTYRTAILKRKIWLPTPKGTDLVVCLFGRGGLNHRRKFPKMKLVFISSRSLETLKARLTERCLMHGIDPTRKLEKIKRYEQLGVEKYYDVVIYNDGTPEQCARQIARIVGLPEKPTPNSDPHTL